MLEDFHLLSRISGGDLIAIKAKYHMRCLTTLRNKERSVERKKKRIEVCWQALEDEKVNESRTFVELKEYIMDAVLNETYFFVMPELHSMYENCLKDFGNTNSINRFRLKNRLLEAFPEASEQSECRQNVIVFQKGMAAILKETLKERDFSDDALMLARAAKIVHQDILSHRGFSFSGMFPQEYQETSVPHTS